MTDVDFVTTPDGRRLRTFADGPDAGGALVVLEAGLGASGLYWGAVQARLGARARSVAYERSGYGASDPVASPRTLDALAADLEAVVDAERFSSLVLVGHSWGGPIVRRLASSRLAAGKPVDGLVLVDQSDEHAPLYFRPSTRRAFALSAAVFEPMARLGLLKRHIRSLADGLGPAQREAVIAASSSVSAGRAAAAEQRLLASELGGLLSRPPKLGSLPVRVISGVHETPADRTRGPLVRAHLETVAELPGAVHVRAERSGHLVPVSEPELVAAEALRLLGERAPAAVELPLA